MSNERDELARLVAKTHRALTPYEVADAILAAGCRKPRTITTLRELNSLPALSVIRSQGQTLEKLSDGWYMACIESAYTPNKNWLPATVLHVGDIK